MISRIIRKVKRICLLRKLRNLPGLAIGDGLILKGEPIIDIRNGARIIINSNVTLNSSNAGYHVNMFAPVKLFVDRTNALIEIGHNTRIHGTCIHAYDSIKIGNNCLIAANCQIFDGSGHDLCLSSPQDRLKTVGGAKPINIEDNVWIGANCIILPGVSIGEGSVIAAGSVVTKDIPARTVAGGNPAQVVPKTR
jgi:acetyltransferase-like isoleucine patch superfamily enzyme